MLSFLTIYFITCLIYLYLMFDNVGAWAKIYRFKLSGKDYWGWEVVPPVLIWPLHLIKTYI